MSTLFFFFNDTATTEIYTLSLHDALPILPGQGDFRRHGLLAGAALGDDGGGEKRTCFSPPPSSPDRKSTRLNSSHSQISYAVFCLKKKKENNHGITIL